MFAGAIEVVYNNVARIREHAVPGFGHPVGRADLELSVETLYDILKTNEIVVYFGYGLIFFTMGIIIALHSRKHSRLVLADDLKWLAAFGIVHGVYEWGHAFIPIQATYLSADAISTLYTLRTLTLVFSLYLLLQFGVRISFPTGRQTVVRLFPNIVLLLWLAISLTTEAIALTGTTVLMRFPQTTDFARLIVGFTGAALSSFGMARQSQIVANAGSQGIAWYFRWTALCFGLYAIVAGLIASRGAWVFSSLPSSPWPLSMLSDLPFWVATESSILAPVLRSIIGLGIAFGVIRGLEVFQVETDRFIGERDELQRKGEVRSQLFARVIAAQEEERKRVARGLHDETGQSLSAVIMGLGAAAEALPRDTLKAGKILEDVREAAVQTLEGVRRIILDLRPAILDDLGLVPALRRVAGDLTIRSSIPIEILTNGVDERLSPEIEIALFRILQEGMNNVARHSRAVRAVLRLDRHDSEVRAMLEDDGIGFDPAKTTAHLESGCGLGLMGMRERALLLGGAVIIDSSPGNGTRLTVRLPL